MKIILNIKNRVSSEMLILPVVLLAMLPINPLNMPFVRRDAGVFLYTGWRILNGQVPYRDVWDNKPPMIFYINAAGLAIMDGSRWGIWLIEFILLLIAALISFKLIKKIFGPLPAIFVLCLWMLSFVGIISGGNYATEYTLPLQFACLWLAYESENKGVYAWRGYLMGVLLGISFLTKQNTIGIGLAIVLYILFSKLRPGRWKRAFSDLLLIFFGGITTLAIVVSFFAVQGGLPQFWDAAFVYNLVRSSSSLMNHIRSMITGMVYLSTLTLLAFIGWGGGLIYLKFLKFQFKHTLDQGAVSFLSIGLIDFPIELFLASTSGYSYRHYYLALLPIFAVFAGFALWILLTQLSYPDISKRATRWFLACSVVVFLIPLVGAGIAVIKDTNYTSNEGMDYDRIVSYVQLHTSKDDFVLIWGAEAAINFSSQRLSPSRFVYQYPLYKEGYNNQKMIEEFLGDVFRHKPRLIIDAKNSETPIYDFKITSPQINADLSFLRTNYKVRESLGEWTVYEYVGE